MGLKSSLLDATVNLYEMTLLGLYCSLPQSRLFQTVIIQFKYRVPPKVLVMGYIFGPVFSKKLADRLLSNFHIRFVMTLRMSHKLSVAIKRRVSEPLPVRLLNDFSRKNQNG